MSSITTYYYGLLREGKILLGIETTTATFPAYAEVIRLAEGLPRSYYYLSLERDNRFNSADFPTQFFSQIETALGITLVNGDVFVATPVQAGLTKQQKQIQKLNIAAATRQSDSNPRYTYDINKLPNPYNGNDVDPDENPNVETLVLTPDVNNLLTGGYRTTYSGYHADDVAFTNTATVTATTVVGNFTIPSEPETTTELYIGYLLADYTGTWSFTITSDDGSYLWIGNNAVSGYTTGNALTSASYLGPGTGTISLTAGNYYPIRLLYGNGPASGSLTLTYSHTGQSATNNFTGKLFRPGVKLAAGRPWS